MERLSLTPAETRVVVLRGLSLASDRRCAPDCLNGAGMLAHPTSFPS